MKRLLSLLILLPATTLMAGNRSLAEMQAMGYTNGLCITALHILSLSKQAVNDMLAYIYDEHPTEEEFIEELARICAINGLSPGK